MLNIFCYFLGVCYLFPCKETLQTLKVNTELYRGKGKYAVYRDLCMCELLPILYYAQCLGIIDRWNMYKTFVCISDREAFHFCNYKLLR